MREIICGNAVRNWYAIILSLVWLMSFVMAATFFWTAWL